MVRRDDVRRIVQVGNDLALVLRTGNVVILDPAVARLASDYLTAPQVIDAHVVRG